MGGKGDSPLRLDMFASTLRLTGLGSAAGVVTLPSCGALLLAAFPRGPRRAKRLAFELVKRGMRQAEISSGPQKDVRSTGI